MCLCANANANVNTRISHWHSRFRCTNWLACSSAQQHANTHSKAHKLTHNFSPMKPLMVMMMMTAADGTLLCCARLYTTSRGFRATEANCRWHIANCKLLRSTMQVAHMILLMLLTDIRGAVNLLSGRITWPETSRQMF